MGKQLLREYYQLCEGGVCQDLLTEEEKRMIREDDAMILTGVMQMCGVKNGNGRMYTESVMKREVKKYQELVKAQQALGELDHPQEIEISLVNVSHKVTSIWMDGNKVMGKIQVLNTPAGKTLRALGDGECCVGISSRGTGSLIEKNGEQVVAEDFELVCFDMVSTPSTPGAYMRPETGNQSMSMSMRETKELKESNVDDLINDILNG